MQNGIIINPLPFSVHLTFPFSDLKNPNSPKYWNQALISILYKISLPKLLISLPSWNWGPGRRPTSPGRRGGPSASAMRAQPGRAARPGSRGQAARRRHGGAADGDGAAQRTTINREGEGVFPLFMVLFLPWVVQFDHACVSNWLDRARLVLRISFWACCSFGSAHILFNFGRLK